MTFVEIAERLYISRHTVDNTLREARARLGALSLSHAVVICISRGYLCVDYATADLFIPEGEPLEALVPVA